MRWLNVIFCFVMCFIYSRATEHDLTVEIGSGSLDCFYQNVKNAGEMNVEYQVIDGGDLDITVFMQAPDGRLLVSESQRSEGAHKIDARMPGDYKICFDNTFSHFAGKTVFFEIIMESDEDEDDNDSDGDWSLVKEEVEGLIDMTIEDLKTMMDRIKTNLDDTNQIQHILKNYEARDRNIQESNFNRVNFFSGFQVFILLSVGLTQVLLIQSLFDDKKNRVSTSSMKART